MDNNKQHVQSIPLDTTPENFYNIANNTCPVCKQEFVTPTNMFIQYGVGVHLNCHLKATGLNRI